MTENKENGVTVSFDLTFSQETDSVTNSLWMVYGTSDGGTTSFSGWPFWKHVVLVPGNVTTLAAVEPPPGWSDTVSHVRFFLSDPRIVPCADMLECISTTASGGQYAMTSFKATGKTRVEGEFAFLNTGGTQNIFCSRDDYTVNTFTLFWISSTLRLDYNNGQYSSATLSPGTGRHTLRVDSDGVVLDNTFLQGTKPSASSSFAAVGAMSLFASQRKGDGWGNYGKWTLYSFKVWADGSDDASLALDLVPCSRDGEACLFDFVSSSFIKNKGSGAFVAGTVVQAATDAPSSVSELAHFATSSAIWTGNGTDTKVSNPANWGTADNTELPDMYGGTLTSAFQAGGEALLDEAVFWNGIAFSSEAAFTFADSAQALSLGARGIATELSAKPTVTHTFNVPLNVTMNQTWLANTNATLEFTKPFSFKSDSEALTLSGAGVFELRAANTFTNDFSYVGDGSTVVEPGRVRVYADNALGAPGGGPFKMDLSHAGLVFYGVTNTRPIETYCSVPGDSGNCLYIMGAGQTNVFNAAFNHSLRNIKPCLQRGTTFIVNEKFTTASSCYVNLTGTGTAEARWIFNAPLHVDDRFNLPDGVTIDFNAPTNRINGNTGWIGGYVNLNVPYALAHVNGSGAGTQFIPINGTLDMHGNDNGLGVIYTRTSDRTGTITSETPATMHLVDDYTIANYDSGQTDANGNKISAPGYTNRVVFTGCASLSKEGRYTNRLMKVSSTYGDLTVTKGRLEMDPGATWANASNLVVRGTGLFTLEEHPANAPAFGKHVVVRVEPGLDGNGANPQARIELLNATPQRCAEFYVDGVRQSEGWWGSAEAAAANPGMRIHTAPFFIGTGLLQVYSGCGLNIIFR